MRAHEYVGDGYKFLFRQICDGDLNALLCRTVFTEVSRPDPGTRARRRAARFVRYPNSRAEIVLSSPDKISWEGRVIMIETSFRYRGTKTRVWRGESRILFGGENGGLNFRDTPNFIVFKSKINKNGRAICMTDIDRMVLNER